MRSRETKVADDIYYVDNYLNYHDKQNLVRYLRSLTWFYEPLASYGFQNKQGNMKDALLDDANGYFCNILYYVQQKMIKQLPKEVMPLINRLEPNYLARVKCNLYVRASAEHAKHDYHWDFYGGNHPAMVWCADSADTGLEFKRNDDNIDFVASKANRAIFFNSAVPHRTTCPMHAKERVTININYQ